MYYIVHSILLWTEIFSTMTTVPNLLFEITVCGRLVDGWVIFMMLFSWQDELNINFIDFPVTWRCFLWHWHYFSAVWLKGPISILFFSNVLMSMVAPWFLLLILLLFCCYYYCFPSYKITLTWVSFSWVKCFKIVFSNFFFIYLFPLDMGGKNDIPFF